MLSSLVKTFAMTSQRNLILNAAAIILFANVLKVETTWNPNNGPSGLKVTKLLNNLKALERLKDFCVAAAGEAGETFQEVNILIIDNIFPPDLEDESDNMIVEAIKQ